MRPRLTGPSQCTTCTTGTSLQGHGHPNMCPSRHPKSRPTFLNLLNCHPVLQHGRPSDERLPTYVAKVGRGLALVPPHVDLGRSGQRHSTQAQGVNRAVEIGSACYFFYCLVLTVTVFRYSHRDKVRNCSGTAFAVQCWDQYSFCQRKRMQEDVF